MTQPASRAASFRSGAGQGSGFGLDESRSSPAPINGVAFLSQKGVLT